MKRIIIRGLAALGAIWLVALLAIGFVGLAHASTRDTLPGMRPADLSTSICNRNLSIQLWVEDNVAVTSKGPGNDLEWLPGFPYMLFRCTGDHVMLETAGQHQCLKAEGSVVKLMSGRCYAGDKLEMWRLFYQNIPGANATKFFLRNDAEDPNYLGCWGPFPIRGTPAVHVQKIQNNFAYGLQFDQ